MKRMLCVLAALFQFTPLREGRLENGTNSVGGELVSIHAPA